MSAFRSVAFGLLLWSLTASAGGLRGLEPIAPGAAPPPVSGEAVDAFVHALADGWNRQDLDAFLAPDFPDRERLLASLPERVAPGTRLRVDAVSPPQTVEQGRREDALISVVRVRFRGVLETPTGDGGIRREPTTQELLLRIVREVPR